MTSYNFPFSSPLPLAKFWLHPCLQGGRSNHYVNEPTVTKLIKPRIKCSRF